MMLPLPEFDLLVPTSLDEAVSLQSIHPTLTAVRNAVSLWGHVQLKTTSDANTIELPGAPFGWYCGKKVDDTFMRLDNHLRYRRGQTKRTVDLKRRAALGEQG